VGIGWQILCAYYQNLFPLGQQRLGQVRAERSVTTIVPHHEVTVQPYLGAIFHHAEVQQQPFAGLDRGLEGPSIPANRAKHLASADRAGPPSPFRPVR
jgi:hypothetical protein